MLAEITAKTWLSAVTYEFERDLIYIKNPTWEVEY
jgi:hypothetical protein